MQLSFKVKVPGKLYILGEYNVLKSGHVSLSMAVDRFLIVEIKESDEFNGSENGKEIDLNDDSFKITNETISLINEFLLTKNIKLKKYKLNINNGLKDKNNLKYGLGSSAAIRIGVAKAILELHNVKLSKMELFKLLVLGQIKANDLSSGGDLATSIYGGYVYYKRYDVNYVKSLYKDNEYNLVYQDWPQLEIKTLNNKTNYFNAIFSGKDDQKGPFSVNLDDSFYILANESTLKGIKYLEEGKIGRFKEELKYYYQLLLNKNNSYNKSVNEKHLNDIMGIASNYNISIKPSGSGISDSLIYVIDENENDFLKALNTNKGSYNLNVEVFHYE